MAALIGIVLILGMAGYTLGVRTNGLEPRTHGQTPLWQITAGTAGMTALAVAAVIGGHWTI